jgi:MOSC domain-containing protein YiiM
MGARPVPTCVGQRHDQRLEVRFISRQDLRHLNLRGVYMRVVEDGEIAVDDPVQVLSRPLNSLS